MSSRNRRSTNSQRRKRGHDAALDDAPGSSSSSRNVKFTVVEIREFERVVGDNPSCSSGVPVSIGWSHGKTFTMNLEDFETARPPRRAQMDLVLTRGERHRLLVEWGASGQDVIEAIRMIIRVKNQRRQTVNNLGSYDRIEEVIEKFLRGIKSALCSSSSNKYARQLQGQSDRSSSVTKMQKAQSQATAVTADQTVQQDAARTAPKKSAAAGNKARANFTSNHDRYDEEEADSSSPPFTEVSVINRSHSSFSDTGDDTKKPQSPERPEEAENNTVHVDMKDLHEVISKQEDRQPADSPTETYDDVDDMSNPQSHDHRGGRRIISRTAVVGETVDT